MSVLFSSQDNLSGIKNHQSEKNVYDGLKRHFEKNGDDALVIRGHVLIIREKDFIIINLTKGYIMLLEVKHNSNKVQSAMEQLFENIQKLFKRLDISPWKLIGAFYYERRPKKKNIKVLKKPCFVHSDFVIKKDQLNIKLGGHDGRTRNASGGNPEEALLHHLWASSCGTS